MSLEDKTGQKVPNVTFKVREGHQWVEKTTDDYFKGKKVVLFALPGAYTPTCSSTHLPRYNELFETFRENGIDDVICLSVNDTFVMNEWQRDQGALDLTMMPDGNGDFSKALGFLVEKNNIGFGIRSWRYSMLVNDGTIEKMFIEPEVDGDPFDNSDAVTMLKHINPNVEIPKSISIFTRNGCEHCFEAKKTLTEKGLDYEEHVLNEDFSVKTLVALSGGTTVPQIFVNGERVGGNAELQKYFK